MLRPRAIPVVTLDGEAMVKTLRFTDPVYLGDPRNALRLFNTKQVDELVILDITASRQGRAPDLSLVRELAGECFMPVAFGGGVTTVAEMEDLFRAGVEKVVVNTAALVDPAGQLPRLTGPGYLAAMRAASGARYTTPNWCEAP